MIEIGALDEWNALAEELSQGRYTLYQFQFGTKQPEGFRAWFWSTGRPKVGIVTRDDAVKTAIIKFKPN